MNRPKRPSYEGRLDLQLPSNWRRYVKALEKYADRLEEEQEKALEIRRNTLVEGYAHGWAGAHFNVSNWH